MSARETVDVDEVLRENVNLREQQRAVSRVLRAVARSEGLQPVLDEVVEAATRLCSAKNGRLWLFKNGMLHVVANCGERRGYDYDEQHPKVPDRTSMAGRAALTREVVHIPDVDADPQYTYAGPRPYRSGLNVPIMLDDELIGVIGIVRDVVGPFDDEQIELVKTFADQAAIAIANARLLDAVERQRTELSRFISPQVADLITSERGEQLLAGHRAYISVLFCDLRDFTAFAETAEPEELFQVLREYHGTLGDLIPNYNGTLEHFAGDGLMVFFNDPVSVEDHELQAIRLALAAQSCFSDRATAWRKRGIELGLGIGIAAGYATLGRIGFEGRYDYGALGPVTNLASRLSSQAQPGQILISQRTFAAVEDDVEVEPAGELELKGFSRPVGAYEVRGLRAS
ncbi:MAG: GAF domain-containing protein [Actinobacteria bacterium]|nr:GAF domain-containing protein [Actinomycetota bacterium]